MEMLEDNMQVSLLSFYDMDPCECSDFQEWKQAPLHTKSSLRLKDVSYKCLNGGFFSLQVVYDVNVNTDIFFEHLCSFFLPGKMEEIVYFTIKSNCTFTIMLI